MSDVPSPPDPRWYCVRCRVKAEHIAGARLRETGGVEVCCPRIRFRRATARGPVWFTEALFPGYLFARFDLGLALKTVCYARGVTGVVHFGGQYAEVPAAAVEALRAETGGEELKVFEQPFAPGDETTVLAGPFQGLQVVIRSVLPAKERVRILLDFLGRATEVEVDASQLAPLRAHPLRPNERAQG